MTARPLQTLMRRLRRVAGPPGGGAPTDGQLLDRWAQQRDEAAFELLLWRHGPLVRATCRRLLRDHHLADDAFQATWLILLRKAGSLRRPEALAAWLHRVAFRVALRARGAAARRSCREVPPVDAPAPAQPDELAARDVQAVLDEEVDRLPEHHRRAFVLCCLEGKTHAEAARELARPQGTVAAWLARARQRLRVRLARRGLAVGAVGSVVELVVGAPGVPGALVDSMVRAAALHAAGAARSAEGVSARAVALTEEVFRAMRMTRLKCVLFTAVLAIGCVTGLLCYRGHAQPPGGGGRIAPPPVAPATAPAAKWQYKAVARTAIEELGRKGGDGDALTTGLNRLAADGWDLVGIDPTVPLGTGGQLRPSTYVFRRPTGGRTGGGTGSGGGTSGFGGGTSR